MPSPELEQLAERVAALEARLTPSPQAANPPITIGAFANVPAPGSAILSAWSQDVTRRVIHGFATVAAMKAWAAADGSYASVPGIGQFERINSQWVTSTRRLINKTTDASGFVTITAAELGFTSYISVVLGSRKTAPDAFVCAWSFDAPLTILSVKVFYVDPTGLLKPATANNRDFDLVATVIA
jgi:hypothetical protein